MSTGAKGAKRGRYARSGLLIGASVSAIVTFSAVAAATDAPSAAGPQKWAPYVATGAQAGDQGSNGVTAISFTPLWQDLNSLVYLRLGVGSRTGTRAIGNFGLGFRTKLNNEWMAGIYAGVDSTNTRAGNTFSQGAIGGEVMSADWEARLNGYLANAQRRAITGDNGLVIQDTRIAILHGEEQAYSGFDGEVGYRVFNTDNIDIRVLAGGFNLTESTHSLMSGGHSFLFNKGDMIGPQARAELDLYNVNLFGRNSRITFTGKITHDDVRGTSGFVGALLQVPLGDDHSEDGDALDRRMVDPLHRQDYVMTGHGSAPEQVIIYDSHIRSTPTNTLYYVDNSAGAGTYADPTTLHDATSRGPHNQFVVLTDREGVVNSSGVTVQSGESVVGPGTFKVKGVNSGEVFTHTFAPGSGPVTVNTTDGITLDSGVNLEGFAITGAFTKAAIYGHNVGGIVINAVNIHGTGAAANGIYFHQDNGSSGDVTISNGIVDGVTQDGIKLAIQNATGSSPTQHFDLTNLTVTAGQIGVAMNSTISGGASETTYLGIHSSTLTGGTTDLNTTNSVAAGSALTQTVLVDPTHITGGVTGLNIADTSTGGTLTDNITLDQVYITGVSGTGLNVAAHASANGSVNQAITLHTVMSNAAHDALHVYGNASGGSVTQTITGLGGVSLYGGLNVLAEAGNGSATQHIYLGNTASNGEGQELYIRSIAGAGGIVDQRLSLNNLAGAGGTFSDVYAGADASNGGHIRQNIDLANLKASIGYFGAFAYADHGSYVNQVVGVDHALIAGDIYAYANATVGSNVHQNVYLGGTLALANNALGVNLYADATSNANQYVTVHNTAGTGGTFTTIVISAETHGTGASHQGVYLDSLNATAGTVYVTGTNFGSGSLRQEVAIDHLTVNGTGAYDVNVGAYAHGGMLSQYIDLNHVDASGASTYDFAFIGKADAAGAALNQYIYLANSTASGGHIGVYVSSGATNGAATYQYFGARILSATNATHDNIELYAYAGTGSTDHQAARLLSVTSNNAADDGLYLRGIAHDGGHAIQNVYVSSFTGEGNGGDGIRLTATADNAPATPSSVVGQYLDLRFATIAANGGDGIGATVTAFYQSTARQDLSVRYSYVGDNTGSGLYASATAAFYGAVQQNITLIDDQFNFNGLDGATISASAFALGFAQQSLYVDNTAFYGNGGNGLNVSANAVFAGQTQQNLGIYDSAFNGNAGDGMLLTTYAYGYAIGSAAVYYSHAGQNVIAEYNNASYNGHNGVEIQNTAGYGAQINQFVYLYRDNMNSNGAVSGGNGLYEHSQANAFGTGGFPITTNIYADLYVIGGQATDNFVDGLRIKGDAVGPTYMIQHLDIENFTASYNGRSGFVAYASAENFYSLNIQYITLGNSRFNDNAFDGAAFLAYQNYGPLSFGAAIQDVTISGSTFTFNGRDGLYATAEATGNQGRAEQHFAISNSSFQLNGADGASFNAYAHDGVHVAGYDCDTVQGLGGGCAFVRQTVQISGSHFDYNGGDGIYVNNQANNYGAVYNSSGRPANTPTLLMEYSTAYGNTGDGLAIKNTAGANSYLYSYAVLLGSNFNDNSGNGINVTSSVSGGGAIVQKTILYGLPGGDTTANFNTGDGLHVDSSSTGGAIQQLVGVYYSDLNYNTGNGMTVNATANATAAPTAVVGQYVSVLYSDIYRNGGNGIAITSRATGPQAITQQNATIAYTYIGYNGGDGVHAFEAAYNQAAANQYLKLESETIRHNSGDGVYVESIAANQASTQQTLNFDYHAVDTSAVSYNGGDGIYLGVSAFTGATAQQNAFLYGVNAQHNGADGVGIGATTNGYSFGSSYIYYSHVTQNVIAAYENFRYNTGNGLAIHDTAYYGGAMNQFIGLYGMSLSNNGGSGIYEKAELTSVRGNSFAFSTNMTNMLYVNGSTVDHNGGNGIDLRSYNNGAVYAPAFFGGYSYLIQHTHVIGSDVSYNGNNGLSVSANEQGRYGLNAQYFVISGSTLSKNTHDGAHIDSIAYYGPAGFGDTYMNVQISNSHFDYNGNNGLSLAAMASGRQGRAEQHVTISGSSFDHNSVDGINIYASAVNGTYVAGHPCTTIQGLAGGCAFVRQSVVITGSDISNNGNDGVSVATYANNYGAIYGAANRPHSPTLELYDATVDNNTNRGLNVSNHVTGSSYLYQYVASIDSTFDHNQSDGIYAASYVGGGSVMFQRNVLYGLHTFASASYNGGNGFKATIEALGGSYARDVNIVENTNLDYNGSFGFDGAVAYADGASTGLQVNAVYFNTINHNGDGIGLYSIGVGAHQISYTVGNSVAHNTFVGVYAEANFGAYQYAEVDSSTVAYNGVGGLFNAFGGSTQSFVVSSSNFSYNSGDGLSLGVSNSGQTLTITGSDFSHNQGDGLKLTATASGASSLADQHVAITDSSFDYNTAGGIHIEASATGGSYIAGHPCTVVQNPGGGCAVVRQDVLVYGSSISHNGGDGVLVLNYANNFGAIYGAAGRPHGSTLELYGTTVDYNGDRGLDVSNHVTGSSYLYQYAANIDSTFDHNNGDGVYMSSYVGGGSTMLQRSLLYSFHATASASYNAGNGFKSTIEALGGSYARDVNIVQGANLNSDGSFGFDGAIAYADGASVGLQINAVYFNAINHNGDGVGLYSIGAGAQQISYIGGNAVESNAFVGVYGEANFGAFQYVGVYTFGNTVNSNGTDYLFNAFGGATQVLN